MRTKQNWWQRAERSSSQRSGFGRTVGLCLVGMLVLGSLGGSEQARAQTTPTPGAKKKRCRPQWRKPWKMDFRRRLLMDVVKEISQKTCYNFIVSTNMRSKRITIISERAVPLRDAYKAFLSSLEVLSIAVIKTGRYRKLAYIRNATRKSIRTYLSSRFPHPRRDDVVTYMFRPKFLDVYQLTNIVRQLSGSGSAIVPFAPSGVILVIDYANNIRRLIKIVKALDVQEAESKDKMFLIQVENGQAQEVLQKIRSIFQVLPRQRSRALRRRGQPVDEGHRITKILADQRTNRIILVSSHRAYMNVLSLVQKLDIPLADGGKVRVHYLRYAKSDEIAQTLSQLARGSARRRRRRRAPAAQATDLFQGEVRITADKATNSLVIVSNQRDYENLMRVIRRLDRRRKQVFVEMVILEVSMDKSRDIGAVFHGGAVSGDAQNPDISIFGTRLGGMNSILLDTASMMGLALTLRGPEIPNSSGLLGPNTPGIPSFGVVIRALQTNTDVDIISTPHILTAANEEATIQVGQNVPFIAGTSVANAGVGFALPIQNIQRQDVALTMKIKPQLNAGDRVKLDLDLEITEIAGQNPELGPTTTKRKVKTTVRVKDNQTVVIGGLMRDRVSDGVSKVPFLGDIPLLGALFRVRKRSSEKRNLLIFMTPHIIQHPSDFRRLFIQKMKERKAFLRLSSMKGRKRRNAKYYLNKQRKAGPLGNIYRHRNKAKRALPSNKAKAKKTSAPRAAKP